MSAGFDREMWPPDVAARSKYASFDTPRSGSDTATSAMIGPACTSVAAARVVVRPSNVYLNHTPF